MYWVLVFPPVSNYRRFLIHKVVEDSFPLLKTFSIGEEEERRTVICFKKDYKQPELPPKPLPAPEPRTPAKRPRTMPTVGIYRPPAARKLEGNAVPANVCRLASKKPSDSSVVLNSEKREEISRTEKQVKAIEKPTGMPNPQTQLKSDDKRNRQRRPDMQVYVPRGQRIAQEHHRKLEAMALSRDCEGIELDLGRPFEESDGSDTEKHKSVMSPSTTNPSFVIAKDDECRVFNAESDTKEICENGNDIITVIELETSSDEDTVCITDSQSEKTIEDVTIESFNKDACEIVEERLEITNKSLHDVAKADESSFLNQSKVAQEKPAIKVKPDKMPSLCVQYEIENVNLSKKPNETMKSVEPKLNPEECDWESLFDDSGECLEPSLLGEITKSVEQVVIETPKSNYEDYKYRNLGEEFPHVVEVYNFPPEFKTQDLVMVFSEFKHVGFEIKWVDDTHALGIFSNAAIVSEVLCMKHPFVKTRCLSEGSQQSKSKARRCSDALTPYAARPDTCAALARRLVTGALGVRLPTQRAEREAEKKLLSEAREKKRLAARQREQAWEGTLS